MLHMILYVAYDRIGIIIRNNVNDTIFFSNLGIVRIFRFTYEVYRGYLLF